MPRVALPDSWPLGNTSGCLYTPYVQNQHYFASFIDIRLYHCFVSFIVDNLFIRRAFQDPARYPRILDNIDLKTLQGRHAYKASTRSALPDSL
jgi:hypothetical protein